MFKKDFYTEVIRVINLNTGATLFKGGYLIAVYDRIPYVIDQDTPTNKFDIKREIVIPVTEEYFKETPSVNLADRSDYVIQYKIMFQSTRETEVLTALDEFNTYWKTNKQVTIDGYTVGVKAGRGDKTPNIMMQSGDFYSFYTISIYLTAIKNGYVWKDADNWTMRPNAPVTAGSFIVGVEYVILTVGTTNWVAIGASSNTIGVVFTATAIGSGTGTANVEYQTLILDNDTFSTQYNPIFSNKTDTAKAENTSSTSNNQLRIFYNESSVEDNIYSAIMNKLDKDTLFDFKHTFNGSLFTYQGYITGGVRTRTDNGIAILEFSWAEADV